jgi:uncharacterized protein
MPTHVPQRRCVKCGARRPQSELIRLHRQADGSLAVTGEGPRSGRGAYCCPDPACWEPMIRKRLYGRGLKSGAVIADPAGLRRDMTAAAVKRNKRNGVG